MEGHAVISADVLASYAADAALEVAGVHGLVGSALHRHEGVKVSREDGKVGLELHLALDWGAGAGVVGAEVQTHVAECLGRMADVLPDSIDVVIDEFAPPEGTS
jgi:uncharacterized alkaline shock family protein YloU